MPHNRESCNTPLLKIHMNDIESVQVVRQNCNAAEQRKRVSRTSEILTRRTRDKQLSKNK